MFWKAIEWLSFYYLRVMGTKQMLDDIAEVVRKGDERGNNMAVRFRLPSGAEIWGLPTENDYGGAWDLGPTWNYLIFNEKTFLVDTGKSGMARKLLEMMESTGISNSDLDFVILSHGHEDHDGGLTEIVKTTHARVKAHWIYDRLIRFYPEQAPADRRKSFPATCWRCFMPESFSNQHCLLYQQERSRLTIEEISDGNSKLSKNTQIYHLPGHSPDSVVIVVNDEAILLGDTVLPDITPIPSREDYFEDVREILKPHISNPQSVYGLRAYITSLKQLREIGAKTPDLLILPAHRLFYNNHWNEIDLKARIDELIDHHIERCADVLRILKQGPKTAKDVAVEHFEEPLLKGFGILMAENEIISHCELLIAYQDVVVEKHGRFAATGSSNFESAIHSL